MGSRTKIKKLSTSSDTVEPVSIAPVPAATAATAATPAPETPTPTPTPTPNQISKRKLRTRSEEPEPELVESPVATLPIPQGGGMPEIALEAARAKVISVVAAVIAKPRKTLGELKNIQEETFLDLESLHKTCKTGDLIMTYSTGWSYKWYASVCGKKYDKVMMIVKDPKKMCDVNLVGTYVIEPVCEERPTSSGGTVMKYGYKIVPLNDVAARVVHAGHGMVYRSMDISESKFSDSASIPPRISGKPYIKETPKEMVRARFGLDLSCDNPADESSWSAMLIATILIGLDVIRQDISWFMLSPSKFGYLREGRLDMRENIEKEEEVILST